MKALSLITVVGSLFLAASAPTAPAPGKPEDARVAALDVKGKPVDVRFANGSNVLMMILQDNIEIITEFGKLRIPPAEIRSIDFGVHLTDEVRAQIERALKQLGSSAYKEREAAMKQLVDLGPQAYLALHQASKTSKDQETVKRATTAMKTIAQKVPARLLRLREEDRIRTSKFTVVGRIVTPNIKARAEYFGELSLRPTQLLAIRWLEGSGTAEVVVDAGKYGSANNQWMDTGIQLERQHKVKITAAGEVDVAPQQGGQYISGPGGLGPESGLPVRFVGGVGVRTGSRSGALMGRVGETGAPFVIGEHFHNVPPGEGKLYLHIVPGPWGGQSNGSYRVNVITGPSAEDND
jgi:hypothetical protein